MATKRHSSSFSSGATPTMEVDSSGKTGGAFREWLRTMVKDYTQQHQHGSALFWAGQLLTFPSSNNGDDAAPTNSVADQILFAETLLHNGQYRRAAQRLQSSGLDRSNLRACYLAAKAMMEAKEPEEALEILDRGVSLVEEAQKEIAAEEDEKDIQSLRRSLGSVYLLKGKILESLDNRNLAAESFKEALRIDVHCSEAFQTLVQHQILTSEEESELFKTLPFEMQTGKEHGDLVAFLYKMRLKKYGRPEDHLKLPDNLREFSSNLDVAVHEAESCFYNCDYAECFKLTSKVVKEDPFHTECLPIHISCLVELNYSNQLFHLAHKLVELYPDWAVAWFSVGSYYYLVGKQDFARRYLSKATQLDRVFGPAWLAYGHSFALENEHDQAMAAYFKACQLMKGCHLPLLYIGVEYGLTNNAKLAERFFNQALDIAPEDPFVLHELGVTCFQNQDFVGAERFFLKALQQVKQVQGSVMSVKWESLLNNLGHASRKLCKYDDALCYHQQALVLKPLSASTFSSIGYVHALKGELVEAIEAFHKALGIRRDDTFSTTMLNNVIEQLINEEPAFSGYPETVPKFDTLLGGGASAAATAAYSPSLQESSTAAAAAADNSCSSVDIEMADVSVVSD